MKRTVWVGYAILLCLVLALMPADSPYYTEAESKNASAVSSLRNTEIIPYDYWYVIKIAGQPVGYVHEYFALVSGIPLNLQPSLILITSDMLMVLNRLGTRVELSLHSKTHESLDGWLQNISYEMLASQISVRTEVVVKKEENMIEVRKETGFESEKEPYQQIIRFTGKLLGQEGVRRLSTTELNNPGDQITFQVYSPELEKVVAVSRKVIAAEAFDELPTGSLPALKIEETVSSTTIKRILWLDSTGHLLKQEEPSPFGLIEVLRSEKRVALATATESELPEEMYKRSIARTNIRIPQPRSIEKVKLELTQLDSELGWPDLGSLTQTVLSQAEGVLILEVRRIKPDEIPRQSLPPKKPLSSTAEPRLTAKVSPIDMVEYLKPNAYIQSDDPVIISTAEEVIGNEDDVFKAAKHLERWVAKNMQFDMGIVFAPSSEIFRNRRGTCMGYATLLATLARALGIPSRVVMGFVYSHGMFGGHAWVEVLVGSLWIPLDAAIVSDGAADAARFSFATSSLRDGAGVLTSGGGQQLFGNIKVRILEYKVADREKTTVSKGAEPFIIQGDLYKNPWLGLEIRKPEKFSFARLDACWPDLAVLAMEGPEGQKIELSQISLMPWWEKEEAVKEVLTSLGPRGNKIEESRKNVAGHQVLVIGEGEHRALVLLMEKEAWILTIEGKESDRTLRFYIETDAFYIKK